MRRVVASIIALLLAHPALGQTQAGAQRDSAIAAVRAVFQEVEASVKANHFVQHDTTVACGEDSLNQSFAMWRDSAGVVRLFDAEVGSDDSAERASYYYDARGRLRFIFVRYGAVVGAHMEERVYYDENRHELRRLREENDEALVFLRARHTALEPSTMV